jgi:hypothetical protein
MKESLKTVFTDIVDNLGTKFLTFAETPLGQFIAPALPAIALGGGFLVLVYLLLFSPISITEIFLLPFRLIGKLFIALGLKKRASHWGVVYDSQSKEPLDPAVVELRNSVGKRVGQAITDLDGRYGFVIPAPGVYTINVIKDHYSFPSQKLMGEEKDGSYSDLYFGEQLMLTPDQDIILKNIPLDPIDFDWNELAKKEQHLLHSYSHNIFVRFFIGWFFVGGVLLTAAATYFVPKPYTYVPVGVFVIANFLRALLTSSASFGVVKEKTNGLALPFAQVTIFYDTPSPTPIKYASKICDREGRYFCLVPKGRYYVTIERRNPDLTYTKVFTSSPFNVSDGILNQTFEV